MRGIDARTALQIGSCASCALGGWIFATLAGVLSVPLYAYVNAPGPFRALIGGVYSVPYRSTFVAIGIVAMMRGRPALSVVAIALSFVATWNVWLAAFKIEVEEEVLMYRSLLGGRQRIALRDIATAVFESGYQSAGARARSTIALCAIGALLEPPIATAQPNKISDKYVVVNGMADPAAIPEYAAWRHALTMFSLREQRTSSELRDELDLSAVEYALLATEAGQERVRRDACHQRQARVTEEGKQAGWRPSRLQEAIDSVVLECRQAILDAAERLMAKLSDDGRHKVSEFIERSKSTLEMFVEKDRLAFFRQPR